MVGLARLHYQCLCRWETVLPSIGVRWQEREAEDFDAYSVFSWFFLRDLLGPSRNEFLKIENFEK